MSDGKDEMFCLWLNRQSGPESATVRKLLEERLACIDDRLQRLESLRTSLDEAIAKVDKLLVPIKAQATGLACVLTAQDVGNSLDAEEILTKAGFALETARSIDIPW
jgi:hypothetical protein